jgi:hypothetical protein
MRTKSAFIMKSIVGACLLSGCAWILGAFSSSACVHYAPNRNFGPEGDYLPAKFGFNLADVSSVSQLNALPDGVRGLVWVGRCEGVDAGFLDIVRPFVGHHKLFGFYLADGPDPTGKYSRLCKAESLRAEADWIRANAPGAKTFVSLMNLSSSKTPSFANSYNPSNSHVDLFGIAPYPCRTELDGCDYEMIDRYVAAAEISGIPRSSIVPVYQTFGGGKWDDDRGGRYALPSAHELQQILARWRGLIAAPAFDYAYSWGSQKEDSALENAPDLQTVISRHNAECK